MIAQLISIGDEVLIGQIVNTNTVWMASLLNEHGIFVNQMTTIADAGEAIQKAVGEAIQSADIVLITGGLGPTKDDITKKVLADYFGMPLEFHQPSFDNIVELFTSFGRVADDRYRVQAQMPVGAQVLINKVGTASGMWFERDGKIVVSMPGVPREMQYLMQNEVVPRLKKIGNLPTILHRTIQTTGKGETDLSDLLEDLETKEMPNFIKLAYLPDTTMGRVRLRLTARGHDAKLMEKELDRLTQIIQNQLGSFIFGYGETNIESVVGELLKAQNATLATAESCTGGNIARRLTANAGASAYFMGSAIVYSNDMKMRLLGVQADTLDQFGAVSEETVREMVAGTLSRLGTNYAIAVSGIAGPDGGRPDKPVGTIWVAIGDKNKTYTRRLQLGNDRSRNIEMTTSTALNMLRLLLIGETAVLEG
jgi:nicotinamide-nucleotide amidase